MADVPSCKVIAYVIYRVVERMEENTEETFQALERH
jgi:hypothetical protein